MSDSRHVMKSWRRHPGNYMPLSQRLPVGQKKAYQIIIGSLVCVASQSLAPCNVLMLGVRNAKITDCGCELSNYKQWM